MSQSLTWNKAQQYLSWTYINHKHIVLSTGVCPSKGVVGGMVTIRVDNTQSG